MRTRDDGVDLVRGVVMVLMALDHTRDFFGPNLPQPTDLAVTTPALFFTRWITHFCAPAFVLLAGVGAWLQLTRGKSRGELSRFLLTRGLWLLVLEVTVIYLGWSFDIGLHRTVLQVFWALGVSMIVLAALIHLPVAAVAAIGILLIAGHNLLDHVHSDAAAWHLLHERGAIALSASHQLRVFYPAVPWIGVMALGFALGPIVQSPSEKRRPMLRAIGAALCLAFIAIRASRLYGDPHPYETQPTLGDTILSFLNCEKYPPSLCYLLMTLGPILLALGLLDGKAPRFAQPLVTIGRVPLFFYLIHIYLIHGTALLAGAIVGGENPSATLGGVYLAWILIVAALYPACVWYAALKRRRSDLWWLSYL